LADTFTELRTALETIDDLERAAAVLGWDQMTYMPRGGLGSRADHLATLSVLAHERLTRPDVGALLERLAEECAGAPEDDPRHAFLRTARRAYDLAVRIPPDLVEREAKISAQAYETWVAAREANDFGIFAPDFARVVQVSREKAEALGYPEEPYDALLDLSEPGMTARSAAELLDELKGTLVPLAAEIAERGRPVDRGVLQGHFPDERQWDLGLDAIRAFGFDFARGRQDRSIHPFTTSFGVGDVRITTRIDEEFFASGLYSTLHEAGHGMYEQGLPAEWQRTPLGKAISSGVHESQSRLWENFVGRSQAFWSFFLPKAQEAFPAELGSLDLEAVYRAVNAVERSLVRVDADEVTYNLHIAVRLEVERALLQGELAAEDVPAAWAEKMRAYLGIVPPDDLQGALQDIHWTGGLGGFIGYTVGNVVAGQLWQAAERSIGDLPGHIARGDFAPLLAFLRRGVHELGSRLTTEECLRQATGQGLTTEPYLRYIEGKFRAIYAI